MVTDPLSAPAARGRSFVRPRSRSAALAAAAFALSSCAASPLAGRLSDRVGRPRVLAAGAALQLAGAAGTLLVPLPLKLLALAVFTFGFFTAHAVASTAVGRRGGAEKAAASAHYLLEIGRAHV